MPFVVVIWELLLDLFFCTSKMQKYKILELPREGLCIGLYSIKIYIENFVRLYNWEVIERQWNTKLSLEWEFNSHTHVPAMQPRRHIHCTSRVLLSA